MANLSVGRYELRGCQVGKMNVFVDEKADKTSYHGRLEKDTEKS